MFLIWVLTTILDLCLSFSWLVYLFLLIHFFRSYWMTLLELFILNFLLYLFWCILISINLRLRVFLISLGDLWLFLCLFVSLFRMEAQTLHVDKSLDKFNREFIFVVSFPVPIKVCLGFRRNFQSVYFFKVWMSDRFFNINSFFWIELK